MTMHDEPDHREDAGPGPVAPTYRPHAGTWNTRVRPVAAVPLLRYDPFAALGHEASRHGHAAGAAHALHEQPHDPATDRAHEHAVPSLWPHADEPADGTDERRTAWTPNALWRPTPSVPFPRPAPPTELDPPTWA